MATEIDNRIVEMQFDNKQFEAGVKQTTDTLDKFKESLKFEGAEKGFQSIEDAARNVKLAGMTESVDEVADKFNWLTDTATSAINVLASNITSVMSGAMGKISGYITEMSDFGNIGSGWNKYEEQLKNFQMIFNNAKNDAGEMIKTMEDGNEYVKAQMDKLMWYTDETSYSFQDMTSNIGRFTSNGIGLETAVTSMMGIANAAGLSGTSIQNASHAMDGFSKAMGMGYMSRQNWRWIETARMDTEKFKQAMIDAGEATGTLTKIGDGLWETIGGEEVATTSFLEGLKDKWLDVETMNLGLEKFGQATEEIYSYQQLHGLGTADEAIAQIRDTLDETGLAAFMASQEAKTFTDVVDAVKDAVSSGWMKTFELIFGDYQESVEMWTALANNLWEVFAGPAQTRNDILQFWHDFGGREALLEGMTNSGRIFMKLLSDIRETFADVFGLSYEEEEGDQFGLQMIASDLTDMCVRFAEVTGIAAEAFGVVPDESEEAGEAIDEVTEKTDKLAVAAESASEILKLANSVIDGAFGSGEARRKALEEQGHSYEVIQNKVNELLGSSFRYKVATEDQARANERAQEKVEALNKALDGESEAFEELEEIIYEGPDLGALFVDSVKGIADALSVVAEIGKGIIGDVIMPIVSWGIPKLVAGFLQITGAGGRLLSQLVGILKGPEGTNITDFFANIHLGILDILGSIDIFIDRVKNLASFMELGKRFENFANNVRNAVTMITQWFSGKFQTLVVDTGVLDRLLIAFDTVFSSVVRTIDQITPYVNNFLRLIGGSFAIGIDWIINAFNNFNLNTSVIQLAANALDQLTIAVTNLFNRAKPYIDQIKTTVQPYLMMLLDTIYTVIGAISSFISNFNFSVLADVLYVVVGAIYMLGVGIKNVFELIQTYIEKSRIKGFLGTIKARINTYVGYFKEAFAEVKEQTDKFKGIKIVGETVGKVFGDMASKVTAFGKPMKELILPVLKSVKERLAALIEPIKQIASKIKFDDIMKVVKIVSILTLVFSAASIFKNIGGIFEAISGVFTSISGTIKAIKGSIQASMIIKYAVAIGILAGSIWALASLPKDKLIVATECLAIMAGTLAGLLITMTIMNKMTNNAELLADSGLMAGIAALIGVITYSMLALQDMDLGTYAASWLKVLGILALVLIAMKLMNEINASQKLVGTKNALKNGISLFLFATSLKKTVDALMEIADADFWQMQTSLLVLVEVMGILGMLAAAAGKLTFGSGMGMIGIVGAIFLFVKVVDALQGTDFKAVNETLDNLGHLLIYLGIIAVIARVAGNGALGVAGIILATVYFLEHFSKACNNLAVIPENRFNDVMGAMALMMALVTVLVTVSQMVSIKNMIAVGGILAAMTAAVIAITVLITAVSFISNDKFKMVADSINQLIFVMSLFLFAAGFAQKAWGTILTMAVIIGAIAGLFALFDKIKNVKQVNDLINSMMTTIVGLAAILIVLAAFEKFLKVGNMLNRLAYGLMKGFIALGVGIGVGIAAIGAGIAVAGALIGAVGWFISWVIDRFGNALIKITTAAKTIESVNGEKVKSNLENIAGGFKAFVQLLGVQSDGSKGFHIWSGWQMGSLYTLCEKLAEIKPFIEEIGKKSFPTAMANMSTLADEMKKFANKMTNLGISEPQMELFGQFANNIGAMATPLEQLTKIDDVDKIKTVLTSIGEGVAAFVTAMTVDNANGTKIVDPEIGSGINKVFEHFDKLAKGLNTIQDLDAEKIMAQMKAIGYGLGYFAKALCSKECDQVYFDTGKTNGIVKLVESVETLGNGLHAFDGIDADRIKFSLQNIGEALKSFGEAVNVDDLWDVIGSSGKADAINKITNNIGQLGENLRAFINATDQFYEATAPTDIHVDPTRFRGVGLLTAQAPGASKLSTALGYISEALTTFADAVDTDSIAFIFGGDGKAGAIVSIIGSLPTLADNISYFIKTVPVSDAQQVETAMDAISKGLEAVSGALDGGFFANLTSPQRGEAIYKVMTGLKQLAIGVGEFDRISKEGGDPVAAAGNMSTALEKIRESLYQFAGTNGVEGGNLVTVLTTVMELFDKMQTYDFSQVSTLIDGSITTNMTNAFDEMKTPLGEKFIEVIDSILGVIQDGDRQYNFYAATRALMGKVKDGIEDRGQEVIDALTKCLDDAAAEAKKKGDSFQDVGTLLMEGMAAGIAEGLSSVKQAIKQVIDEAHVYALSPDCLNCGSPSHRFRDEVGLMAGLGIADGILKSIDANKEAVKTTIMSTMGSASYAISHSDSDYFTPTLTPVLDMSEARTSATDLSGMFDNNYALGIAKAQLTVDTRDSQIDQLVDVTSRILGSIQNGSDLYLDDRVLAGRINRRLGAV